MLFKRKTILFYPNIILCDENCYNAGENLTSIKAICKYKLKSLLNEANEAKYAIFKNIIHKQEINIRFYLINFYIKIKIIMK